MPKTDKVRRTDGSMGEFDLIARYFEPLTHQNQSALGLLDDAALFENEPGYQTVVTTDALISGVHFLKEDAPELIGRKALRVNLSDLAAMGAQPFAYTLALMLPERADGAWLERFSAGLAADQQAFDVFLAGGDTVKTPGPLALSVTAFGRVEQGRALRRSGAGSGDLIFVTGSIGEAGLGLRILTGEVAVSNMGIRDRAISRYHLPEPRVKVGRVLGDIATAAMDVSDGLLADLRHMSKASAVKAEVHLAQVPFVSNDVPGFSTMDMARAGDDYELLFTAPADKAEMVASVCSSVGETVTVIGRMSEAETTGPSGTRTDDAPDVLSEDIGDDHITVLDGSGEAVPVRELGFRHF